MKLTEFETEVAAVRDRRNPWKVGRGAGQALGRLLTKGVVVHNGPQVSQGERFILTKVGEDVLGGLMP